MSKLAKLTRAAKLLIMHPRESANRLVSDCNSQDGTNFAHRYTGSSEFNQLAEKAPESNPLRTYFDAVETGLGIWKWEQYFEMYHRHLNKYVNKPVNLVEVGVYSGGSIGMWRAYLGERCIIHGVDIQESCRAYANEFTTIHIGDQGDPEFWDKFLAEVPDIDIFIDDGGHLPHQQRTTLEKVLPMIRPGGVYVCEDIHGRGNQFFRFMQALSDEINAFDQVVPGELLSSRTSKFQSEIASIHYYPYAVVIEKRLTPIPQYRAPKHGTEWQPFAMRP